MDNIKITKGDKMGVFDKIKSKIRGTIDLERLCKEGLIIGENFHAQEGVIIDPGHCWLIEIGDNVTLAPRVHILAHDASSKNIIGYTRVANVKIGNNVFLGASTIVLPGVKIDDKVIVGAGSVVTKNLQSGVYAGNPCKKICSYEDFVTKQECLIKQSPIFDRNFIIGSITDENKKKMKSDLEATKNGFVI